MGIGVGRGEDKVKNAVRSAIDSPLLETTVSGAKAILLNITGGYDLGMMDVTDAANLIQAESDKDAIIIFGAAVREDMKDELHITVIATGFENKPSNYAETGKFFGMDAMAAPTQESEEEAPEENPEEPKQTGSDFFNIPSFLK